MHLRQTTSPHADLAEPASEALTRCMEECFACAEACTVCAGACLAEDGLLELREYIRVDLDCAGICLATGRWRRGGAAPTCASCASF